MAATEEASRKPQVYANGEARAMVDFTTCSLCSLLKFVRIICDYQRQCKTSSSDMKWERLWPWEVSALCKRLGLSKLAHADVLDGMCTLRLCNRQEGERQKNRKPGRHQGTDVRRAGGRHKQMLKNSPCLDRWLASRATRLWTGHLSVKSKSCSRCDPCDEQIYLAFATHGRLRGRIQDTRFITIRSVG